MAPLALLLSIGPLVRSGAAMGRASCGAASAWRCYCTGAYRSAAVAVAGQHRQHDGGGPDYVALVRSSTALMELHGTRHPIVTVSGATCGSCPTAWDMVLGHLGVAGDGDRHRLQPEHPWRGARRADEAGDSVDIHNYRFVF